MRLFIATPFPKKFKSKIFKLTKDLRDNSPRLSWVKECNLHFSMPGVCELLTVEDIMRYFTPRSKGDWARDVSYFMEEIEE